MPVHDGDDGGRSLRSVGSHFAFGENWSSYAALIDPSRIDQATRDLGRLTGDLHGRSFLDIGCGSGLHALAAIALGATRVEGFDIDPKSVETSQATLERFSPDTPARFRVLSIFDVGPEHGERYDVVYSWGVLHHTGDMVESITRAARLVAPSGLLVLGLYRRTRFCNIWRRIKRWYSRASPAAQKRARFLYVLAHRIALFATGRSYREFVRSYASKRGMNWEHDVHDWLGGYPYESISPTECEKLLESLGFRLEKARIVPVHAFSGLLGSGCDEYVFERCE